MWAYLRADLHLNLSRLGLVGIIKMPDIVNVHRPRASVGHDRPQCVELCGKFDIIECCALFLLDEAEQEGLRGALAIPELGLFCFYSAGIGVGRANGDGKPSYIAKETDTI